MGSGCFKFRHKSMQPVEQISEEFDDAPSLIEVKKHLDDVEYIYESAVDVMQRYVGKPTYPFSTEAKQLYPYILKLCKRSDQPGARSFSKKRELIRLKVTLKEVKIMHPNFSNFSHVFCKLWVGKDKSGRFQSTSAKVNSQQLWWDESFTLDITNTKLDALHLEVWSSNAGLLGTLYSLGPSTSESPKGRYFIGDIIEPIKNIPSFGTEVLWPLKKGPRRVYTRGQVKLFLEFIPVKNIDHNMNIHLHIAFLRLAYEKELDFQMERLLWKNWMEILPTAALTLVHQHALQNGISLSEQYVCSWIVLSSLKMRNEHRISFFLLRMLLEDMRNLIAEDPLEKFLQNALKNNINRFFEFTMTMLKRLHRQFDIENAENLEELFYMLRCMCHMEGKQRQSFLTAYNNIEKECRKWYLSIIIKYKNDLINEDSIEKISEALNSIVKLFLKNQLVLDSVLSRAWSVSYTKITCKKLDTVVSDIIGPIIEHLIIVGKNTTQRAAACLKMLQLYHNVRSLYIYCSPLSTHGLRLERYSEWFGEEMLLKWFLGCYAYTKPFMTKVVDADTMEPLSTNTRHGTSFQYAVDIIDEMILEGWSKLKWEDKIYTHNALVKAIKSCVLDYMQALTRRVTRGQFFAEKPQFKINEKLCVALSNAFALYEHLSLTKVNIRNALAKAEQNKEIFDPMDDVESELQKALSSFYLLFLDKVKQRLTKILKQMTNSKMESFKTTVMSELCTYIENVLEVLYRHLKREPFYVVLRSLWVQVVLCLEETLIHGTSWWFFRKNQLQVYLAIYHALNQLLVVFHCDGNGLSLYEIRNSLFRNLKTKIESRYSKHIF